MSASRDPVEAETPPDPAAYRRQRLMGVGFWAMIAFSILCVLAGAAIATYLPRILGERPPAAVAGAPVAARSSLQAPPPLAPPIPDAAALATAPAAPSDEVLRLGARLSALEAREMRVSAAAAGALAAAALVETAQSSRPFAEELKALEAVAPASAELRSLHRLAETGAPSHAALASSFPDYAARAANAGRAPGEGAGLLARAIHALSQVVSVRRVGDVAGPGVDAVLARAERLMEDGEVDQALRVLDELPAGPREALGAWRMRAERRAEIDRRVAAVRTRALQDLAAMTRPQA